MKKLFTWAVIIIGIWLIISSWLLPYTQTWARWHDSLAGGLFIIFGAVFMLDKGKTTPNWPHVINGVVGLWLVVSGVLLFGRTSGATLWNEIITGILAAIFSLIATQIIEGQKSYVFTKDGGVLVEMTKMAYKEGYIEMKGKAFGSMPQTMRVAPEQIWYLLGMVPFEVITHMPKLIYLGWKKTRNTEAAKDSK